MKVVYFDLETTAGRSQEIIHIGAKYGRRGWEQYILPDDVITAKGTQIHGMYEHNGTLYNQRGNPLPACAPMVGYERFLKFLFMIKGQSDFIVLCAHNCKNFDMKGMYFRVCLPIPRVMRVKLFFSFA